MPDVQVRLSAENKWHAVKALNDFIESVAEITCAVGEQCEEVIAAFPRPDGLGTDGTCWTDEQLRQYALDVVRHSAKRLTATLPVPEAQTVQAEVEADNA